jgi:hypothetical protein
MTKQNWIAAVSWMPLHSQSWWQLRATVVHDPARRVEAWRFMTVRSWAAQGRPHHEGKLLPDGERNRGS